MPGCLNPVWPCALTGAVTALSGFSGIAVVIHGSSGCYFYPATLLHHDLHSTFLVEQEVIFGTSERLVEVVKNLSRTYKKVAVVNSCVPSILGEDVRDILSEYHIIFVDSPGFVGDFESGYLGAVRDLPVCMGHGKDCVNIEGINLIDPFARGNQREAERLLHLMGVSAGTIFCHDSLESLSSTADFTVTINPDLSAGYGHGLGSFLGLPSIRKTVSALADVFCSAETAGIENEIQVVEERITKAADKYLKRFDPPSVAIFSTGSYAGFASATLQQYLDADIVFCGSRNEPLPSCTNAVKVTSLAEIGAAIREHAPDLVLGSTFERSVAGTAAFVGLTPPVRGEFRLSSKPLAGTEGELSFMEDVLNACMDHQQRKPVQ
ncbi:MAG: oxidoreductase [Methanomicrobiales archaeon]|nr:oxidoreductase [Methanomicrobiales archaeon]